MSRAMFSNHCLMLFTALFTAALWTHSTVPAEDEPWGIANYLLLLTLPSHCAFLTFSVPPHPSTPSIFRRILQGSDRMGLLAREHGTAACSFQPDFLYLWSLGIASCIMVQIPQRSTTAPVPATEGHPDTGSHLPQHQLAQYFFEPAFGVLFSVRVYRHSCATGRVLQTISKLHTLLGFCRMGVIYLCA